MFIEPKTIEHAEINGQCIWHYLLQTTIGDLHIVQYEARGEKNIIDAYMGWDDTKANKVFKTTVARILKGKV